MDRYKNYNITVEKFKDYTLLKYKYTVFAKLNKLGKVNYIYFNNIICYKDGDKILRLLKKGKFNV